MDDQTWISSVSELRRAVGPLEVLTNCVKVTAHLDAWRVAGDEVAGGTAADALEQAKGMLERLRGDEGQQLLALIETLTDQLPPAWD